MERLRNCFYQSFFMTGEVNKWFAVGISEDKEMGSDLVTECILTSNGRVEIRNSFNDGKQNLLLKSLSDSIVAMNRSYENGLVNCKWKRNKRSDARNMVFDLQDKSYYLLLASGALNDDRSKAYHDDRLASNAIVDFASAGAITGSSMMYLLKIHGNLRISFTKQIRATSY